jgi:hypothetical protein
MHCHRNSCRYSSVVLSPPHSGALVILIFGLCEWSGRCGLSTKGRMTDRVAIFRFAPHLRSFGSFGDRRVSGHFVNCFVPKVVRQTICPDCPRCRRFPDSRRVDRQRTVWRNGCGWWRSAYGRDGPGAEGPLLESEVKKADLRLGSN